MQSRRHRVSGARATHPGPAPRRTSARLVEASLAEQLEVAPGTDPDSLPPLPGTEEKAEEKSEKSAARAPTGSLTAAN